MPGVDLPVDLETAGVLAAALALVLLVVVILLWRRGSQSRRDLAVLADQLGALAGQLEQLRAGYRDAEVRELRLGERLAALERQQELLLSRDAEAAPYFAAIRHAAQGEDLVALMSRTGVSRGEAELIIALHGSASGDRPEDSTD